MELFIEAKAVRWCDDDFNDDVYDDNDDDDDVDDDGEKKNTARVERRFLFLFLLFPLNLRSFFTDGGPERKEEEEEEEEEQEEEEKEEDVDERRSRKEGPCLALSSFTSLSPFRFHNYDNDNDVQAAPLSVSHSVSSLSSHTREKLIRFWVFLHFVSDFHHREIFSSKKLVTLVLTRKNKFKLSQSYTTYTQRSILRLLPPKI